MKENLNPDSSSIVKINESLEESHLTKISNLVDLSKASEITDFPSSEATKNSSIQKNISHNKDETQEISTKPIREKHSDISEAKLEDETPSKNSFDLDNLVLPVNQVYMISENCGNSTADITYLKNTSTFKNVQISKSLSPNFKVRDSTFQEFSHITSSEVNLSSSFEDLKIYKKDSGNFTPNSAVLFSDFSEKEVNAFSISSDCSLNGVKSEVYFGRHSFKVLDTEATQEICRIDQVKDSLADIPPKESIVLSNYSNKGELIAFTEDQSGTDENNLDSTKNISPNRIINAFDSTKIFSLKENQLNSVDSCSDVNFKSPNLILSISSEKNYSINELPSPILKNEKNKNSNLTSVLNTPDKILSTAGLNSMSDSDADLFAFRSGKALLPSKKTPVGFRKNVIITSLIFKYFSHKK
ncbi:hypothetical protein AYI68_g7749 [Smittium mucronatum]|uniref:Uncharacterized protein n=1 Tax=Smittium mucronatum TaxID=133383 RepID=A0A1R0GMW2_9FUNG|nr:hypothetical protein AYI68_g7749 [Smittium mucronatum]